MKTENAVMGQYGRETVCVIVAKVWALMLSKPGDGSYPLSKVPISGHSSIYLFFWHTYVILLSFFRDTLYTYMLGTWQ